MNAAIEDLSEEELSSQNCPLRYLARITLELETPLHIGTGKEWDESDAGVVLDANGLPTLPLSGIIGVLRHAFVTGTLPDSETRKAVDRLFGFQGPQENGESEGQGSRLRGSFGYIHDASNTPVYGILKPERYNLNAELVTKLPRKKGIPEEIPYETDPVLAAALRLTLRDHARHNESGVAASKGKFDELVVCAGHRFTFELELTGQRGSDETAWDKLFTRLADPLTRLGGKSRRGLGRFKVERVLRRCFDLKNGDFEDYADYDSRLDVPIAEQPSQKDKWESFTPSASSPHTISITLRPRFFWMFGAGSDLENESDRAPVRDRRIVWANDVPEVRQDVLYLPGSGMKGGLRHRAWFHAQAKFGHFADNPNPDGKTKAHTVVTSLFGNEPDAMPADLQCGKLLPDDYFEEIVATIAPLQNHVSIDRFTGGARDALLFDEKPAWRSGATSTAAQGSQPGLRFVIHLSKPLTSAEADVLRRSLDDLTHARLAIGGGTGRGHGFCDGSYQSVNGENHTDCLAAVTEAESPIPTP